jgi:peptidoglycan lytic transglycosylase G
VNSNFPPGGNDRPAAPGTGDRAARSGPTPVPPPPRDKPTILRSPRNALEPDKVSQPKRRSKRVRHPLVIAGNAIFTVMVVISLAVGAALYFGKQRFDAPGPLEENKTVNIPRGLGSKDIAALLQREGVIDQPYVFMGGVLVMKARGGLKHGEYEFTKHASLADVIETIIGGKVVQHALTVPEGLTSEQIVARLLENKALTGQIKEIPHEGSLLPETYKFTRGITREQIIHRMQQAARQEVKEIWAHRVSDLPIATPEEMVTLASIVEKETGRPEERSRVAAVFVNRLKNKMKLQSDPTIIYGLTGGKGSLGRPIMKSEIEQPTPYNTYVINGLPPGPIVNPGRASLEAVAKPARTKDLFFVADGTGGHVFSETYEQHQRNVAKLRAFEHVKEQQPNPAADKKNGDKP